MWLVEVVNANRQLSVSKNSVLRTFVGVETAALTYRTKLATVVISVTANDSITISF